MANDTATAATTTEADKPVELTAEQKAANAAAAKAKMDELVKNVAAKFNNKVEVKPTKFSFKTIEEVDDKGKATGIKTKRPSLEFPIAVPSLEGVVDILNNGLDAEGKPTKSLQLLLETVEEVVYGRAREILGDGFGNLKGEEVNADNFPYEQLNWDTIANLPRAERRGGGISKDIWDEFIKDYEIIMPGVTGKSAEAIANHGKIYATKFNTMKTNKKALNLLKDQLGIYLSNSPNAENYVECVDFLVNKADALLKIDDSALLANL